MSNYSRIILCWDGCGDSDEIVEKLSGILRPDDPIGPDAVVYPCGDPAFRSPGMCCEGTALWSVNHADPADEMMAALAAWLNARSNDDRSHEVSLMAKSEYRMTYDVATWVEGKVEVRWGVGG